MQKKTYNNESLFEINDLKKLKVVVCVLKYYIWTVAAIAVFSNKQKMILLIVCTLSKDNNL